MRTQAKNLLCSLPSVPAVFSVFVPFFLFSLSTPGQTEPFPLIEGMRWTYQLNGRYAAQTEVLSATQVNGFRNGVVQNCFGPDGLSSAMSCTIHTYVAASGDGLLAYAWNYGESHFDNEPPIMLLPERFEEGFSWTSETWHQQSSSGFGFTALVKARETVRVPAGDFEAWRIEYTHTYHLGNTHDATVWITPGVGAVHVELRQESHGGMHPVRKQNIAHPLIYKLAKFGPRPRASADSPVSALFERLAEVIDSGGRQHVDREVAEHGVLSVRGWAVKDRIRVGERLPVEFRIRNDFTVPVHVLPSLDKSDTQSCDRPYKLCPCYAIVVRGPKGSPVEVPRVSGCGNWNQLAEYDFVELQPGEELDPLRAAIPYHPKFDPPEGPLSDDERPWQRHYVLSGWRPSEPGRYTIRCIYETDTSVPGDWSWRGPSPLPGAIEKLLRRMPRGRFESNEVTLEVE